MFGDVGSSLLEGDVGSSLLEGDVGSSLGDLIPGVNFTDLTCNYSFIVEQFSNGSNGMCA